MSTRSDSERISIVENEIGSLSGDVKELSVAVHALVDRFNDVGKPNYVLMISAMGLVGAMILLYIAPVRTDLDSVKGQQSMAAQVTQAEVRRVEEDRRRDEDKFDDRLQREMRLVTDVVSANSAATKEMIIGRMAIDEKRLDDVTNRVDGASEEDRKELHAIFDYLTLKEKVPAK